jgi:hypothetical protein
VITHYAVLVTGAAWADLEREYRAALDANPASLKRPDKLRGLSPWNERPAVPANLEARVREIIGAMDPRGAWVEDGVIGKADRVVSVFAAKDMVVTVGGRTLPMKENDTLEVFAGPETPKGRIIRSRTFADHIAVLSAYLADRAPGANQ